MFYFQKPCFDDYVYVAAGFSARGKANILFVSEGRMTANEYVRDVLPEFSRCAIRDGLNYLQHDGLKAHWAAICINFNRNNIQNVINQWPGNSGDLTMENVWSLQQRKVDLINPKTKKRLKTTLTEDWKGIEQRCIINLVRSFPIRLQECSERNGLYTKY